MYLQKTLQSRQIVIAIKTVRIEFDASKNLANIRERGLGFERVADFDFGWGRSRHQLSQSQYQRGKRL